jgi:uncharacterized membrane protein
MSGPTETPVCSILPFILASPDGAMEVSAASGGVGGGIAGQHTGRAIPTDDLTEVVAEMQPNTSAIVAMVEDTEAEALIGDMKGYTTSVVAIPPATTTTATRGRRSAMRATDHSSSRPRAKETP